MDVVYRIPAVLLPGWGDKDVGLEAANHQPAQLLSAMCFDAERHLSTGRVSSGQGGIYLGAHKTAQCQAILKSLGTPFLPASSGSGASTLEGVAKALKFFFKTKGKVLPASRKNSVVADCECRPGNVFAIFFVILTSKGTQSCCTFFPGSFFLEKKNPPTSLPGNHFSRTRPDWRLLLQSPPPKGCGALSRWPPRPAPPAPPQPAGARPPHTTPPPQRPASPARAGPCPAGPAPRRWRFARRTGPEPSR